MVRWLTRDYFGARRVSCSDGDSMVRIVVVFQALTAIDEWLLPTHDVVNVLGDMHRLLCDPMRAQTVRVSFERNQCLSEQLTVVKDSLVARSNV
jgi:hypothetical protein